MIKEINRDKVQDDALDIILKHNRCGLGISMGVGKTRIAIQHLLKNYDPFIRALVVIPKLTVMDAFRHSVTYEEILDNATNNEMVLIATATFPVCVDEVLRRSSGEDQNN